MASLQPGGILLTLDRAGICSIADIWLFTRVRRAGDEVEARFIRDRAVCSGRAPLSSFEKFGD